HCPGPCRRRRHEIDLKSLLVRRIRAKCSPAPSRSRRSHAGSPGLSACRGGKTPEKLRELLTRTWVTLTRGAWWGSSMRSYRRTYPANFVEEKLKDRGMARSLLGQG